jgi:hypothetical protein
MAITRAAASSGEETGSATGVGTDVGVGTALPPGEPAPVAHAASARARSAATGARRRAAGLLHDFDYERYPDTHPMRGADELGARGYRDDVVEAILGHGDHTGIPRTSLLATIRETLGL